MPPSFLQDPVDSAPGTLPCPVFHALFDDVVANAADALTVARVESHTQECRPCRLAMGTARAYRRAMQRVGTAARASSPLRARVLDSLRGVRRTMHSRDSTAHDSTAHDSTAHDSTAHVD